MPRIIKCGRKDGQIHVDRFINDAFEWYKKEMKKHEDDGRYMYQLAPQDSKASGDDEGGSSAKLYKRYTNRLSLFH
eukprot:gene14841-14890_t